MQLACTSTTNLYRLAALPYLVSQWLVRFFDMFERLCNVVLLTGQLNKLEPSAWVAEWQTTRDVVIIEETLQLQTSSVWPGGYFEAVSECSSRAEVDCKAILPASECIAASFTSSVCRHAMLSVRT